MMELIEAEPAVRVGRVAAVLGGRLEVEEAKLARGVGVALFRPSATEGLGREVGDFTPSGEATEVRVGPVPVVGEVGCMTFGGRDASSHLLPAAASLSRRPEGRSRR